MSRASDKAKAKASPDGFIFNDEKNEELNELALALFKDGGGKQFLEYLQSFTNGAFDANVSEGQLRHMNGMKYLVAIIQKRMDLARASRREQ